MNPASRSRLRLSCLFAGLALVVPPTPAADYQILGWNNLGMHCMDSDYSVFSILPPYNTIECQLIATNQLVTNAAGYTITYEAIADASSSINRTAMGKGNFYQYDELLYGVNLLPEMGLAGWGMPGPGNVPQAMTFERTNSGTRVNWWRAEGIPISPYDDAGKKNPYPLMRLIAKRGGIPIATNDIVLPVSDEMDCRTCHASGTQAAAQPTAGWVWSENPERDYRLNILRLHDESNFAGHQDLYVSALAAKGFNPQGLYRGVVADGKPVLCAVCHASEALGTGSYSNIPPLTASVHAKHASVVDPELLLTLDHSLHRAACYRCHPGSTTKCLRGAMGASVAADGTLAMQCQSCHGNLSQVGKAGRKGWLDEPDCQSCHVGNATANGGRRYTTAFTDTNWTVRLPLDSTFATDPNTPATPYSLYRFSSGHGGLQCSACHGSTHAEFPSSHANDNVRNLRIQGHGGMVVECSACHVGTRSEGGPHGMHVTTTQWADSNHAEGNTACETCHGMDGSSPYGRGTELSELKSDHFIVTGKYGQKGGYRGYRVGCFTCHNGTSEGTATPWKPALSVNVTTNTVSGAPVAFALTMIDTNTPSQLTNSAFLVRVISQPANGTVGIRTNGSGTNWIATYYPEAGFVGTNTFTFAAWNTYVDSALYTGTVAVAQGPFSISARAFVPPNYPALWTVPFAVVPSPSNAVGVVTVDWNFGDGSVHSTNQYATHAYPGEGGYTWKVVVRVTAPGGATASTTNAGNITITAPMRVQVTGSGNSLLLAWPVSTGDALLEQTATLNPSTWSAVTNVPVSAGGQITVIVPRNAAAMFYRLRKL